MSSTVIAINPGLEELEGFLDALGRARFNREVTISVQHWSAGYIKPTGELKEAKG